MSIPYFSNEIIWPELYGILTPVCLEVKNGLKVLHSTSDILGFAGSEDHLEIVLYGDRDLTGEIVFEGPGVMKIISATIDSGAVEMIHDDKRTAFLYRHEYGKELTLNIKLD